MRGMDRLLQLQDLDTAIGRLSARRRALEDEVELSLVRAEADQEENVLGELRLRIDEMARDQARMEHEIDSLAQKGAAEQKRLYDGSIVNTKELESLQREIENLTRRTSDREDELLGLMEERERIDTLAIEAEKRSGESRARVEQLTRTAATELTEIVAELATRDGERRALAGEIDAELLELYEDLRGSKKGVGAAALIEGVCQGCHEKLAAMELDRLKRDEGIRRCQHCRRIVIFT